MTQPPKGGPAFASTPDVEARPQPAQSPRSRSAAKQAAPAAPPAPPAPAAAAPAGSASWSAAPAAPASSGNGGFANPAGAGFSQPTMSNGAATNGGVTRTAAPGALAALDAQTAAVPTAPPRPPATTPAASGRGAPAGAATATSARRPPRGPRRARLQLRHLNPWSVLKFSCVLSVFLFFMWMLTIAGLYEALNGAGVIGKINDTVTTINGNGNAPVTVSRVLGASVLVGVINMVMFIALSTVGSVVYNFISDLIGGVELTLSEGD